jgi:hypothetical protein
MILRSSQSAVNSTLKGAEAAIDAMPAAIQHTNKELSALIQSTNQTRLIAATTGGSIIGIVSSKYAYHAHI